MQIAGGDPGTNVRLGVESGHDGIYVCDLYWQAGGVMFFLASYAILIMLITLVAAKKWPAYDRSRLTITVALPGPILLILAAIGLLIYIWMQPRGPGEVDAGGMALIVITGGAAVGAMFLLFVGLAASWLSIRVFRSKG
jgi:hypothetical protein